MKNLFLVSILSVFVFTACKKEATPILSEELVAVKTVAELDEITNTGVSMVFYHATHCSICEMQRPTVELVPKNATVKGKAKFAQVDYDFYRPVFEARSINSFPQIIIYKDGVEKARLRSSGHSEVEIVALISAHL
jgi:thiol-disulfide isomerase/thioredoxin